MLTVGIVDDGVGIFHTCCKLRQVLNANFICKVLDISFPLSKLPLSQLYKVGRDAIVNLLDEGCDIVVLSSVAMSSLCYKKLASIFPSKVYSCEAPVLHASTYTASSVLVCGENLNYLRTNMPNVLCCAMENFPILAEQASERIIVEYIDKCLKEYIGKFDCIALASSSMNMYKNCFLRVCPNVRVFDSLDGVARKIRKKYKKNTQDESVVRVINEQGQDLTQKYGIFFE